MTEKKLNKVLAAVFLIVGLMASINTFRLHSYINSTLPRDQAQEDCQNTTLDVLRSWVVARDQRDNSVDIRDDAIVVVINSFLDGGTPQEQAEKLTILRNATTKAHETRDRVSKDFEQHPLPNC